MIGVDSFVSNNFAKPDFKFDSCINAIVYGYIKLLEEKKTYSRNEIKDTASKVRGKKSKSVELEDFLRHDLVTNYINPNRPFFDLKHWLFQSGVEEFSNNIKTGILDIKVSSPLLNGDIYFIFECKRLNKNIVNNYINQGVLRFVEEQYYPELDTPFAGMISFLESSELSSRIDIETTYETLCSLLEKHKNKINLTSSLLHYQINCSSREDIDTFHYVYVSTHLRAIRKLPINIVHIVLDYNSLINN